jgi:hypothetical protein
LLAPDVLKGLYADIKRPSKMLNDATGKFLSGFECPQLASIDAIRFERYAGYISDRCRMEKMRHGKKGGGFGWGVLRARFNFGASVTFLSSV